MIIMASSFATDQPHQAKEEKRPAILAWKSIRKHFPSSQINNDEESRCDSITLRPIENVDLTIEFCFLNSKTKTPSPNPSIIVKSDTLAETFMTEFEKVLERTCINLSDWQILGDEIEKILQCVEIKRKEKKGKKRKNGGRKKAVSRNVLLSNSEVEDTTSHPTCFQDVELDYDFTSLLKIEEKVLRANYFIAIRIHNEDVVRNVSILQKHLVGQEELLTKGVLPKDSLHLTLCNLGLDSANDLLKTIEAMNNMKDQLQRILPQTPFCVHSVSQFFNRAIFAKIKVNDDFLSFRELLIKNLKDAGVEFREDHESYTPHATVIKVRRPERRAFGTRNIQSSIYENFVDSVHGEQKVDALYLCAMGGQKREDGFYVTACELQFDCDSV